MPGNSNSGRKQWLEIDMERVSDLAFLGLSYRHIAMTLGISRHTVYRRCWKLVEERRKDRDAVLAATLAEDPLRAMRQRVRV